MALTTVLRTNVLHCDIIILYICSALEALRNALYKFKTYLLTYFLTTLYNLRRAS